MFRFLLRRWRKHPPQEFRPVILVTGAGSGIGLALANLLYARSEYRVVCTARAATLEKLKTRFCEDERFWLLPLDVTSEADRQKVMELIAHRWGGVNILINNAGISYRSTVEHMTEADEIRQMATNYFGPIGLIRLALPYMRDIGRGKIINVSSVSGMLAMPTMASYSASKYALEGASEALWYEMKPLGISVSLVQPGFVHSESFRKVYYTERSRPEVCEIGPYCDYYRAMTPFIERLMHWSRATPEKIAALILRTIQTQNPPLWIPASIDALLFYYMRRILPRRLLLPILFYSLPGARHWGKGYSHRRRT